jgi:succinyl-diaminopimelate desuccinylase
MISALELTKALVRVPSITPARGAVFDVLEAALSPYGFHIHRMVVEGVENMVATRTGSGKHLAYAGHLDVVPLGEGWSQPPWGAQEVGGLLYGRGVVDMKASVAAFCAAAARVPDAHCSLLITGDEEGAADYGTREIIAYLAQQNITPDYCLVGEPTSVHRLGDMVKIGRRGSVNMEILVRGTQGHVAYPHLADNPIPHMVRLCAALVAWELDKGNAWFQPSHLEITSLDVGNAATNVIPAQGKIKLNIRFNTEYEGVALVAKVEALAKQHCAQAEVQAKISGEAFLTPPGAWSEQVQAAVEAVTGIVPELSTTGGTSDARFLSKLCPTVEFGLPNVTMHKIDEAASVRDIEQLADIFTHICERVRAL